MEVHIKSEALREIIGRKLQKKEVQKIEQEELGKIKELTLNQKKLSGKKNDIYLQELIFFKGLEQLTICGFEISDFVIDIINQCKTLKKIQFTKCKWNAQNRLKDDLEYLVIDSCTDLKEQILGNSKCIRIVGNKKLDLAKCKHISKIQKLYLQNCNIFHFAEIINFKNLYYLNLDGSKISDKDILEKLAGKIEIHKRKNYDISEGN